MNAEFVRAILTEYGPIGVIAVMVIFVFYNAYFKAKDTSSHSSNTSDLTTDNHELRNQLNAYTTERFELHDQITNMKVRAFEDKLKVQELERQVALQAAELDTYKALVDEMRTEIELIKGARHV